MRLDELNFRDTYPKQFQEFMNDYKKYKNSDLYYVQFSDHATNIIDKRMYDAPDHTDPMGIYGYPLKYVIEHPADIWYGKKAKYLRVLKLKNLSTALDLQSLTLSNMNTMLYDMRINTALKSSGYDIKEHLGKIKKKFNYKGSKALHKAFMSLVQCVLDDDGMPTSSMISAKDQNVRFRLAGYNVLIDNARNPNTAMINDREPSQVIILTRDIFNIDTVYQLRSNGHSNLITGENDDELLSRKIAGMIFRDIGDSLKDSMGKGRFWSKGGIELLVAYDNKLEIRMDKMQGTGYSKPHKEHKLHDDAIFSVSMDTKYGILKNIQDSNQTIDSFIADIVKLYKQMEKNNTIDREWNAKSKQEIITKQEKEDQERLVAKQLAEESRYIVGYTEGRESMIRISKQLGIDFNIPSSNNLDNGAIRYIMKLLDAGRRVEWVKQNINNIKKMDDDTKDIIHTIIDTSIEISKSDLKFVSSLYNKTTGVINFGIINIIE